MKKCLLIDDLALKGWKSIIEKSITKTSGNLEVASTFEEAINKIQDKYDLIFLDIRLTEKDHNVKVISDYSGYKILKEIKKDFLKVNYSTPVILITASNKIWNIDEFRNYGVDAYYIKEHPDYVFSKENSLNNLSNLQNNFLNLIKVGCKRNEIWELCSGIIELINKHSYFKDLDPKYLNIKNRIIDKLKLGYSHLFKNQTKIEKDLLLSNNESVSFIIFWSILEEISKGFTDINKTWDNVFNRYSSWKFRNKEYFIEEIDSTKIKLNFSRNKQNQFRKTFIEYSVGSSEYKRYTSKIINLSDQIYSLLSAYSENPEIYRALILNFQKINNYRNDVDFIHPSVNSILTKSIITKESINDAYDMNVEMLKLINKILNINTK